MKPKSYLRTILYLFFLSWSTYNSNAQEVEKEQLIKSFVVPPNETENRFIDQIKQPKVYGGLERPEIVSEGIVLNNFSAISEKTSIPEPIMKGTTDLIVSIYDAWWTDAYDADGDGYVQSATLNWDADVSGGTGSLNVYMMIYYKPGSGGDWTLVTTTANYTITDNSVSDAYHINLHNVSHGLYDWRIDIYQANPSIFNGFYGPLNDAQLDDFGMELAAEDVPPTAFVYDAWWTNEIDNDGDGYFKSTTLNWDADVSDGSSVVSVYEKIYCKSHLNTTWLLMTTTSSHSITGISGTDSYQVVINYLFYDEYDIRIDIFRSGQITPDDIWWPADDPDLTSYPLEESWQDIQPKAVLRTAFWANIVDDDGDGYAQQGRLTWNSDVLDGHSTLEVYENVYWKIASSSSWNLLVTTSPYTIRGLSAADIHEVDLNPDFNHNLYDWRIEVFTLGNAVPDDALGPQDIKAFDDFALETSYQDVEPFATIDNVRWTDEIDLDGDGYTSSAKLNWDASVSDGHSSLDVWLDIFFKASTSGTWTHYANIVHHTITGSSVEDYSVGVGNFNHDLYDWRIDISSLGHATPDVSYYDHPVVNAYAMETPADDAAGTAIISGPGSMCEGVSATFTASATGATSYYWEVATGWLINSGQGTASVNVTAGSNSGNICVTPSGSGGTGSITCEPVLVNTLPGTTSVTGNAIHCPGSTANYTASASSADSYTWSVPPGWTINSGQGSASISVTVGSDPGNICATPSNACGNGTEGCKSVTIATVPGEASVGGPISVCIGSEVSYTALASNAGFFNWTIPSGWSIISGQGTASITATAGSISGDICATPVNSCGEGPTGCITSTIYATPGAATIEGEEIALPGSIQFYAATSDQANYYTWTVPAGWSIVSGQGTNTLGVTIGENPGELCVTPMNDCFTGVEKCMQITVSYLPGVVNLSGDTSLCNRASGIYIANASNTDGYTWTVSGNWSIQSGQGTAMVVVLAGSEPATICVTPTNSKGDGTTECMEVALRPVPEKPNGIVGETNPMVNESYTYSVNLIPNADSYIWTTTDGNPEDLTQQISFVWNTTGNQQITVKLVNECGESGLTILDVLVREPISSLSGFDDGSVRIYPNPAHEYILIEFQGELLKDISLSITDITGKLVYLNTLQTEVNQMNISKLKNGIYILSLKSPDWILTKKIIKE